MRDRYDPTFFPNDTGPTLPPAHFVDASGFGVVPFRVTGIPSPRRGEGKGEGQFETQNPHGESEPAPAKAGGPSPRASPRRGEGEEEPLTLDALCATIDALTHEARWRGPPREMPLSERMAGWRTVARLNAAIAEIATLLSADPPSERRAIHLTPVPTGVLVTLDDLKPALAMAARALRWLEERRHWQEAGASWGEH